MTRSAEIGIQTTRGRFARFVPLVFIAGLVAYKWNAASITIQKVRSLGVMTTRPDVIAFGGQAAAAAAEKTLNYFAVIWPALAFGILISAAVRAFVQPDWFAEWLTGGGMRAQVVSGLAGAPLMLCSCCVVSVFNAVYERSSRLGPSLAIMLGSPALNPAALVLTFLLFGPQIAAARLCMAASVVFLSGLVIERLYSDYRRECVADRQLTASSTAQVGALSRFFRALGVVAVRTLPVLVAGVICSMLLVEYVPAGLLTSGGFRSLSVVMTASIALPIAMPTFFEIPLALGLSAVGAPIGAIVALLFAGPVINLPSLFALARSTNWKIAASLAGLIWILAVFSGLILNLIAR